MISAARTEVSVFINDLHEPYSDAVARATVLEFIGDVKPGVVFANGDMVDCAAISRYDKSIDQVIGFQKELDALQGFWEDLRKIHSGTVYYLEGNHEARLRALVNKYPELSSLRALEPESLFSTEKYRIGWIPQENHIEYHGIVVTHGTVVKQGAGASAKGELAKWGTSGISGHTHRQGSALRTDLSGSRVWYENGCLCDLSPSYMIGVPDWQHCIALGEFEVGTERFQISQLHIDRKGRILHGGKLYDGR
jgi:hypothetical protein